MARVWGSWKSCPFPDFLPIPSAVNSFFLRFDKTYGIKDLHDNTDQKNLFEDFRIEVSIRLTIKVHHE